MNSILLHTLLLWTFRIPRIFVKGGGSFCPHNASTFYCLSLLSGSAWDFRSPDAHTTQWSRERETYLLQGGLGGWGAETNMHFEKGKETMRRPHVIVYIIYYMSTNICPFCIVSDSNTLTIKQVFFDGFRLYNAQEKCNTWYRYASVWQLKHPLRTYWKLPKKTE